MLMFVSVFHHLGWNQLLMTGKGGGANMTGSICGWEFDTLAAQTPAIMSALVSGMFWFHFVQWRRVGHL